MGQIGPRDIGADLDFGADLTLSILQCRLYDIAKPRRKVSRSLDFLCFYVALLYFHEKKMAFLL